MRYPIHVSVCNRNEQEPCFVDLDRGARQVLLLSFSVYLGDNIFVLKPLITEDNATTYPLIG